MGKFIDLTGQKFGKLTVISKQYSEDSLKNACEWLCQCDCGNIIIVSRPVLIKNNNLSCGCLPKHIKNDLTGKSFGRLLVLKAVNKPSNMRHKGIYWLCRCLYDGNEITVRSDVLLDGNTRSCGCLLIEQAKENISHKRGIIKLNYGEASINRKYSEYKAAAAGYRNLNFDISRDIFITITQKNCFYCGKEPSQVSKSPYNNGDFTYNGIDRIDNNKDYTIENCVPCCGDCNHAKGTMTSQEFLSWIERVYKHSIENKETFQMRLEKLQEELRNQKETEEEINLAE
jgi:hypothetical protein